MSMLDRWVSAYRQTWEHSPQVATALALQLRDTPSPFARLVTRDAHVSVTAGQTSVLIGPTALQPLRVLQPLKGFVLVFDEFNYRIVDSDGNAVSDPADPKMASVLAFTFGEDERERPELPRFALSTYLTQAFGAVKPRILIPRNEDLRARVTMAGSGGAIQLSVIARYEPEALLIAAGLTEPDTAGREGSL